MKKMACSMPDRQSTEDPACRDPRLPEAALWLRPMPFRKLAERPANAAESSAMEWWRQRKIDALEWTITAVERLGSRSRSGPAHLATGLEGEKIAYFYLLRSGYAVVNRRWSSNRVKGDLDLVAWHKQTLCIVEVKTRTVRDFVPAEMSVDSAKRAVLRRLTRDYIRRLPHKTVPHVRFDILSIYLATGRETDIHHFKDAFGWSDGRRQWE